jgi:hypothetical protein
VPPRNNAAISANITTYSNNISVGVKNIRAGSSRTGDSNKRDGDMKSSGTEDNNRTGDRESMGRERVGESAVKVVSMGNSMVAVGASIEAETKENVLIMADKTPTTNEGVAVIKNEAAGERDIVKDVNVYGKNG